MDRSRLKEQPVQVALDQRLMLEGDLGLPPGATDIVLFAHGSGSSRHSSRNRFVSHFLQEKGLGTLLLDLLTLKEEQTDLISGKLRFNIPMLAERLVKTIDWLKRQPKTHDLRIGLFGASTGAGAALIAASKRPAEISAVVSRGGRPDLAMAVLSQVQAPTLLIVGGNDIPVIEMNQEAYEHLGGEKQLVIIPGATHLFEEPGALEAVAQHAAQWFLSHQGTP